MHANTIAYLAEVPWTIRVSKTFPGNRNRSRRAGRMRNGDDIWAVSADFHSEKQLQCVGAASGETDYAFRKTKSRREEIQRHKKFVHRAEIIAQNLQKSLVLLNEGQVSATQIAKSTEVSRATPGRIAKDDKSQTADFLWKQKRSTHYSKNLSYCVSSVDRFPMLYGRLCSARGVSILQKSDACKTCATCV